VRHAPPGTLSGTVRCDETRRGAVANPRRLRQRKGWAFGLCVAVLEPLLLLVTKRRWKGGENIPETGGCVLALNHISHLDPLTCAHFVYAWGRIVRFLAKAEVFDVPLVGRVVRSAGQIPVYRLSTDASRSFTAAVEAVKRGESVIVYPEGTITRQPDLWPMTGKTGAARIALSADVPVIPIAQWGAHTILPPYTKTPKLFPRKTICMSAGPPVELDDLRDKPLTPDVLREATDRIMGDITRLLEDIRGEQAPPERFDPRKAGVRLTGNPRAARNRGRRRS
jgi:1-acyl-sn-glycerol-3-phosphate acyltransferase